MVLALSQTIARLGSIVITEGEGLKSQSKQHRVGCNDQVVTIEVIQNRIDVAHAEVSEDEGADVSLLGISRGDHHDKIRDCRHQKHMTDIRAKEVSHAEHSNCCVESVAQIYPSDAKVEEPADGEHAEPDKNQAYLILREAKHY